MKNIFFLILISIIFGCTSNIRKTDKQTSLELTESLLNSDETVQVFRIVSDIDTIIKGDLGTEIHFYKNCFGENEDDIIIELKECYSIADILMNGLSTRANNFPLETDGMVFISAKTKSGKSLVLKEGGCTIKMPSKKTGMYLFYGEQIDNTINWNADTLYSYTDTIPPNPLFNEFRISKLGWINADKFLNIENKTDLIVQVPQSNDGITYSLVFHDMKTVLPAIESGKNKIQFSGIPENKNVTLIALGVVNKKYYFKSLNLNTSSKNAKIEEAELMSKEEIRKKMNTEFKI